MARMRMRLLYPVLWVVLLACLLAAAWVFRPGDRHSAGDRSEAVPVADGEVGPAPVPARHRAK